MYGTISSMAGAVCGQSRNSLRGDEFGTLSVLPSEIIVRIVDLYCDWIDLPYVGMVNFRFYQLVAETATRWRRRDAVTRRDRLCDYYTAVAAKLLTTDVCYAMRQEVLLSRPNWLPRDEPVVRDVIGPYHPVAVDKGTFGLLDRTQLATIEASISQLALDYTAILTDPVTMTTPMKESRRTRFRLEGMFRSRAMVALHIDDISVFMNRVYMERVLACISVDALDVLLERLVAVCNRGFGQTPLQSFCRVLLSSVRTDLLSHVLSQQSRMVVDRCVCGIIMEAWAFNYYCSERALILACETHKSHCRCRCVFMDDSDRVLFPESNRRIVEALVSCGAVQVTAATVDTALACYAYETAEVIGIHLGVCVNWDSLFDDRLFSAAEKHLRANRRKIRFLISRLASANMLTPGRCELLYNMCNDIKYAEGVDAVISCWVGLAPGKCVGSE